MALWSHFQKLKLRLISSSMSGILSLEHVQVHFSIFQYQLIGLQVWHRSNVFPIEFDYSSHQQFDEIHTLSEKLKVHKIRVTYLITFVSLERYRCSVASDWMLALAFLVLINQSLPSFLSQKKNFGHGVYTVLRRYGTVGKYMCLQ